MYFPRYSNGITVLPPIEWALPFSLVWKVEPVSVKRRTGIPNFWESWSLFFFTFHEPEMNKLSSGELMIV